MKKLLLASNGTFLIEQGYGLLGVPLAQIKIGYVTTASKGAESTAYLERHKKAMTERGYNFEETDIEGKGEQELRDFFKDKNVIHVEGGNTFYLLKAVKETGFDKILKDLIDQGKIYVGTSAGAYIACPTIEVSTWGPNQKDRYGVTDFTALNLVPFLLKAHYTDDMKELIKERAAQSKYPVRVLKDGQGILVENGSYRFVGEGEEVNTSDMHQPFIDWAKGQLGGNVSADKEEYGDVSTVYRLRSPKGIYFLKVGSDLDKERERLKWLDGKLPVPKIVGFTHMEDKDLLLLSAIEGVNLAELCKSWPAGKVVDKLVGALRSFHALNPASCPFGNPGPGKILIHGDACLPNFIFQGDEFSGYVDLGNVRVDDPEVDFSAAVWSLNYNLGPGHEAEFLKKYGVSDVTEELVERLRLRYEEMQKEWDLI